jgi:hypothetical protein
MGDLIEHHTCASTSSLKVENKIYFRTKMNYENDNYDLVHSFTCNIFTKAITTYTVS